METPISTQKPYDPVPVFDTITVRPIMLGQQVNLTMTPTEAYDLFHSLGFKLEIPTGAKSSGRLMQYPGGNYSTQPGG